MTTKDHLSVLPDLAQGYVQIDRHTVVLRRFTIRTEIDGCRASIDVEIQNDGTPRCLSVNVEARRSDEGQESPVAEPVDIGVTNGVLRKIKVAEFIARARKLPMMTMKPGGSTGKGQSLVPLSVEEELGLIDRHGVGKHKPTRGKPLTDRHLEAVAKEYKDAVATGLQPAKRICEIAGVSRPTAAKWIRAARDREFLGPAIPGKAGEAQ